MSHLRLSILEHCSFFQPYYEKDVDGLQKYWAPSVITKHGGTLVGLSSLLISFYKWLIWVIWFFSRVAENMQFTTYASGFQ